MSSKNNVEYMFGHIPLLHWVHVWCAACWGDITNRHPHAVRHAEWARDGCEKSSCRWPKTLPSRRGIALFFVDLFDLRNIGSEHLTELSSFYRSKVTHFIPENLFLNLMYIEVKVDGAHPKVKDPYSCHVVCLSSLILQNSCFFLWLKHMFPDPTSIARHKRPSSTVYGSDTSMSKDVHVLHDMFTHRFADCCLDLHSIWAAF